MSKRPEDRFANLASAKVTMSAANTLSFAELQTGISLGAGKGILVDQIDYYPSSATLQEMTTANDNFAIGWSTSDNITGPDASDRRELDFIHVQRLDFGTAATAKLFKKPYTRQFFPPLIVAAPRLYLWMVTTGLASAAACDSRMFFRYIDLDTKEYLELAETFILVG